MTEEERVEREVDREIQRKRNTRILQAVLGIFGVFLVVTLNFWFTIYYQNQSNHQWCDLIVSLDDRNQSLPVNASQEARDFAARIHVLRSDLDCPRTTPPTVKPSGN